MLLRWQVPICLTLYCVTCCLAYKMLKTEKRKATSSVQSLLRIKIFPEVWPVPDASISAQDWYPHQERGDCNYVSMDRNCSRQWSSLVTTLLRRNTNVRSRMHCHRTQRYQFNNLDNLVCIINIIICIEFHIYSDKSRNKSRPNKNAICIKNYLNIKPLQ